MEEADEEKTIDQLNISKSVLPEDVHLQDTLYWLNNSKNKTFKNEENVLQKTSQIALKYSYIFRSTCKFFSDDSMLIVLCTIFFNKGSIFLIVTSDLS